MVGMIQGHGPTARTTVVGMLMLAGFAVLLVSLPSADAQPPPATPPASAPSNCDYDIDNNISFSWDELDPSASGTGTPIPSTWFDLDHMWIPAPFPFYLCGTYYYDLFLVTKGVICFGSGTGIPSACSVLDPASGFPSGGVANPAVMGYHTDLFVGGCGGGPTTCVWYAQIGTAPNRRFVYEFKDVPFWGGPGPNTFEIKLFESTGCVETHFKQVGGANQNYNSASGYQDNLGANGWQYDFLAGAGFMATNTAWRACPSTSPPPPPPQCKPVTVTMAPGSYSFTAGGGTPPYTWSVIPTAGVSPTAASGTSTFSPTFASAGNYDVIVTGANGSSSTCKVNVVLPGCGYAVDTNVAYDFVDIDPAVGGGGTPVPGNAYYWYGMAVQPAPDFEFPFCGTDYKTLWLAGGGYICLTTSNLATGSTSPTPPGCNSGVGGPLPSTATPNAAIYGFWHYLDTWYGCNGKTFVFSGQECIFYKLDGVAPNRVFIYEFKGVGGYYQMGAEQTFQIKLFESGCIEVHYQEVVAPGSPWDAASAGYENQNGQAGYQYFRWPPGTSATLQQKAWQACPFTAVDDSYTFNEDQAHTFDVTTNDDGAGNPFSVVSNTDPVKGILSGPVGDGSFTYTPHDNAVGSDSFSYTIEDHMGRTSSAVVSITINPVNDAPSFESTLERHLASPWDKVVVVPGWAAQVRSGPSTAADEVNQKITFEVVSNSNPDLFLAPPRVERTLSADAMQGMPIPDGGAFGVLSYQPHGKSGVAFLCFQARDDAGTATTVTENLVPEKSATGTDVSEPRCIEIVLNATPVAFFEASAELVTPGQRITFDSCPGPIPDCSHDPDGILQSKSWDFGDGGWSDEDAPTHSYDAPGEYAVMLRVQDNWGSIGLFMRRIHVEWERDMRVQEQVSDGAMVANAGPDRTVKEGTLVQLVGSQTGGSDTTEFEWAQHVGYPVVLSDDGSPAPTFVAPMLPGSVPVDLLFSLSVQDKGLASPQDFVHIRVVSGNTRPVADAGPPQTVIGRSLVMLDGSASRDQDGDVLEHQWVQVDGTEVPLLDATTDKAWFVAPEGPLELRFRLRVSDGMAAAQDEVVVLVDPTLPSVMGPEGQAPSVVAGESPSHVTDARGQPWAYLAGAAVVLVVASLACAYLVARRWM